MLQNEWSDYVERLLETKTLHDVQAVCHKIADEMGFSGFVYGINVPTSFVESKIVIVNGYPQAWRERYDSAGYIAIDPTIAHCAKSTMPLIWDEVERFESRNSVTSAFMSESRDFGLKSGLSVPVHGSRGEFGMLSLTTSEDYGHAKPRMLAELPLIHLLTSFIHESVRRIVSVDSFSSAGKELSRREAECLLWTSEGKTSWETSVIMGVSERTIVFHLQNVTKKLNVKNRVQAVARAAMLGLFRDQPNIPSMPLSYNPQPNK